MKSFTLISGILITLLGVFFFANPTNLLAIVGWLFALVMLISGVSSLMVYFKRDNENRPSSNCFRVSFPLFLGLFCYQHQHGCSQV